MTSSIKWEPIEDLKAIRDTVGCVLARSAGRVPLPRWLGIHPPMDLAESGDAFVVEIDLPGVQAEEAEVTVRGNRLTVKGKRRALTGTPAKAGEAASMHKSLHCERPTGDFARTLTLPDQVNVDGIVAHLDHGVLTLTMPKKTTSHAVEVQVAAAAGAVE